MLHLNNRQLHIMIGFIVIASLAIGSLMLAKKDGALFLKDNLSGLNDFSEGWTAKYETLDDAKWRMYGDSQDKSAKKNVTEVLNLPDTFNIKAGNEVILVRKIPDFSEDKEYIVVNSKKQRFQILVDGNVIFETDDVDSVFPYHIAEIDNQYKNSNLTIKIINEKKDRIAFGALKIGTYTELMADAIEENGSLVLCGLFLVLMGIAALVIGLSLKVEKNQKYMLNYIALEAFFAGLLFIVMSAVFRTFIRWELINYFLRAVLIIIVSVVHIFVVRCMVKKNRIIAVFDAGILFYCVEFICVMVFAWFRLISFDKLYNAVVVLSLIGLVVYTLLIGSAAYDYKQREERPVFFSNLIIVGAFLIEAVLYITKSENAALGLPVIVAAIVYFMLLISYGIRKAIIVDNVKESAEDNMNKVREQIIDGFNPNLLFASFQTLQNLIKNNSENSTKMIYYISVYVMNNIKAMNSQGEIISFSDELEHVMAYLQLQSIRNSGFSFKIDCREKDFKVPRHSIEPLVENAVKYGIGGKNNRGNVVFRSYRREDGYAIQIIDNGIGFDVKKLTRNSPTSAKNLFDLLENKCSAKTEIISKERKGTVITIIMPMIENELI